tara:strand:+ start:1628 stop:1840 length:213 start_codon:yes stop_codon:yes gene_type:complete
MDIGFGFRYAPAPSTWQRQYWVSGELARAVVRNVTSSVNLCVCSSNFVWVYKEMGQIRARAAGENMMVFE